MMQSSISVQLRACDFDWSKYVNNSKYLQLIEQGRWDWAAINNLDIVHSHLVGAVSNMSIWYKRPIYWEPQKSVQVATGVKEIKRYSIVLIQKVLSEDEVYFEAEVTLALFNTETKAPEKLTEILGQVHG